MQNETLTFLRHVLPPEGWKVACCKRPHGMQQMFVKTFEEQAELLLHWSNDNLDTYHACATFAERGSRKHENVQLVRSLWADIDTREGKPDAPYANRAEAAQAVMDFSASLALPDPLFVDSGFGLHIYWVLEDMPRPKWQRYADSLKAACLAKGLKIDPARTADASSILRTPGTFNFKHAQ